LQRRGRGGLRGVAKIFVLEPEHSAAGRTAATGEWEMTADAAPACHERRMGVGLMRRCGPSGFRSSVSRCGTAEVTRRRDRSIRVRSAMPLCQRVAAVLLV
jgi:hypothetical protein